MERDMVRIVSVLAAIVLIGSPARAADERHDAAVERHWECAVSAARKLTGQTGSPHRRARKELRLCEAEERTLADLVAPEALEKLLSNAMRDSAGTIGIFGGAPAQSWEPLRCAACGIRPDWDFELKVWRPYRHGR
jgi:hypothetical protein